MYLANPYILVCPKKAFKGTSPETIGTQGSKIIFVPGVGTILCFEEVKDTNMIQICDAITGVGKTSSAFRMMLEHPDRKYMYITPYLDRDRRLNRECGALNFAEPERQRSYIEVYDDDTGEPNPEYRYCTKTDDLVRLLRAGRNISSTHQLFMRVNQEALNLIRKQHYILIVDEALDTYQMEYISNGDLEMMQKAGAVNIENSKVHMTDDGYQMLQHSASLKDYWLRLQGQDLMILKKTKSGKNLYGFWTLRRELLDAFADVYMLTYQFRYQDFYAYCTIEHVAYTYIGVERDEDGFKFSSSGTYVPEYVTRLKELIHIVDDDKLNSIANNPTDLSASWYKDPNRCQIDQISKAVRTFTERRGVPSGPPNFVDGADQKTRRMYTIYKSQKNRLKLHGWRSSWIPCTQRGIVSLRNRDVLAYLINRFMNVSKVNILRRMGAEPNNDGYALTTMIQWVWRSAIRDGKEIWLYVPSSRMRHLFEEWIETVSEGHDIQYINERETK